jgi:hypothetical protein
MFMAIFAHINAVPMPWQASAAVETNVCKLQFSYCPRGLDTRRVAMVWLYASATHMCDLAVCLPPTDPGCTTYTMSVHNVAIHDDNSTEPIAIEKVTLGSSIRAKLTGKTSLKAVPVGGSYRVYSLQGQNVAAGPLDGALEISGGSFTLDVGFTASAALFNTNDKTRFEFAVDVFQAKSGSDEGMCVQVASTPYMNDMRAKASPEFSKCPPFPSKTLKIRPKSEKSFLRGPLG